MTKPRVRPVSAQKQLAGFIAKFDPTVARLIRRCRAAMRQRFPTAFELVYDNYNFFVIGYCSTERQSDCLASIAASSNGVVLSFYYGSSLPDPHGILLGSGSQHRFVRLTSAATLREPQVTALLNAAGHEPRRRCRAAHVDAW